MKNTAFRKTIIAALTLLISSMAGILAAQDSTDTNPPREVFVFIRVDDIFMRETDIKPQEIDAFLAVAEKHDAHVILAAIPMRLVQKTNRGGLMTENIRDFARRGHQIAQHGYNHICPFTGNSGHDLYTPGIQGYTKEQRLDRIREGRNILEAAAGKKVVSYVAPGNDGKYMGEDEEDIYNMGYIPVPARDDPSTGTKRGYGRTIPSNDYTWALNENTYQETMEAAKQDFLEIIRKRNEWAILFHDHFTRAAWNGGVTIRWFEEFLTWLEALPGVKVTYVTYEEYYKKFNPGFSTDFN
ncbi:MAG TPA: DUF2334 domain-containing protein [Candidatus Sumerlaeota bacterium]|nr:DUF2334 domain-containing protein [Candidatus Sumerlaeota bacterium]